MNRVGASAEDKILAVVLKDQKDILRKRKREKGAVIAQKDARFLAALIICDLAHIQYVVSLSVERASIVRFPFQT